jgi:nucleoside-diphosphate-sugar epimerase
VALTIEQRRERWKRRNARKRLVQPSYGEGVKRAVVFGGAGFIGCHLVERLRSEGYWVRAVDRDYPADPTRADEFMLGDLRDAAFVARALGGGVDELYQLAAEMGGAGFIFSGNNDARILHDSALINLHTAQAAHTCNVRKVFFSSSACVYARHNQTDPDFVCCEESSAYPADPDSDYGWEKLFAERIYFAHARNYRLDVRIARLHNVYGPGNAYDGGREKAPAALCRKVAEASDGGEIEIWGNGKQARSFLYVADCIDGIRALMQSSTAGPVNIGSERMIRLDDFARLVMHAAGRTLTLKHVPGPLGVHVRTSDNARMRAATGWEPRVSLEEGIRQTYQWVSDCIARGEE